MFGSPGPLKKVEKNSENFGAKKCEKFEKKKNGKMEGKSKKSAKNAENRVDFSKKRQKWGKKRQK